jgi:2-methylcitrate dehydratase PrpD
MTTWEAIVAETSQPHEPRASCSDTLGSFCANLRYAALPAMAIERVKHFFIDYLAIALRASTLDSSQPVRALSRAYPIPGQATLLGRPDPVSPHWAALANGQAAHSMELDDTFLEGSIHTESSVFAACMALAEEHGLSGPRFVEAANEQMFAAPEVCRLMDLTTCAVDARLDAQYPGNWPARVEITLADGRTLAAETTHAKGDPRNSLTEDEVIEKHRSIVTGVVAPQTDDRILHFVHELERKRDFRELTEALKGFVLPA